MSIKKPDLEGLEGCDLAIEALSAPAGIEPQGISEHYTIPFNDAGNYWMPNVAATTTEGVDSMYYAVLGLSAFFFIAITLAVVYLVWKYRHREGHVAEPSPAHNNALEITWTIIPSIICVFLFVGGWKAYIDMSSSPKNAMEIQATAQKWGWEFIYPNGTSSNHLHVPVDEPVRMVMTAVDVLHSFFIPAFRVKKDLVPQRYSQLWFNATKPGKYRLFCSEYCGTDHSQMRRIVYVHPPGCYEKWLERAGADKPPLDVGKSVYAQHCKVCHSIDGSRIQGPSFLGLWGTKREMSDGTSVIADENYIRESIMQPQAKIRAGYPPAMPTFQGRFSEKKIQGLLVFLKSLDEGGDK